jgi:hypothetical protein
VSIGELVQANLTAPPVLAFALGLLAARIGTDLRLPHAVTTLLSTYLLLAIGLKGGQALRETSLDELAVPIVATLIIGLITPLATYGALRHRQRFGVADAAAIAAHYGSVSAVTFTAATGFALAAGREAEGYLPALVAILEVCGIVVALLVAARRLGRATTTALREVVGGKSSLLLAGGVVIGSVSGPDGAAQLAPFFDEPFRGVLTLFLLDLGVVAGLRVAEVRRVGPYLLGFAVVAPLCFGLIGVALATLHGLSPGGAGVFGAMAASASYIAAPAATSVGLPDANPAMALTAALGITFPFNLAIGIPLYAEAATMIG